MDRGVNECVREAKVAMCVMAGKHERLGYAWKPAWKSVYAIHGDFFTYSTQCPDCGTRFITKHSFNDGWKPWEVV